ncbi:MAG: delta-60 repeat domain-containing protein, partial [Chlorobiaceae bacterium]
MNIVIDMNGSPASTVGTNETFLHFYQGTPTQSFSGYQASFQTLWLDKSGASITSIYDLFDTNSDSLADNYTETYTRSGVVWKNSGTITWDANGMFHAQQTAGDMASAQEGYGRLAFDAGGEAVGIYTFSPTASALPVGFGKVATDFGGGQDFGFSVATQSDGKILVAGTSLNGGNFDFVLARFSADGILDTAFGGG